MFEEFLPPLEKVWTFEELITDHLKDVDDLKRFRASAQPLIRYLTCEKGREYFNIQPGENMFDAALSIIKGQQEHIEKLQREVDNEKL